MRTVTTTAFFAVDHADYDYNDDDDDEDDGDNDNDYAE